MRSVKPQNMSTYSKPKTKRQLRHPGSRTRSHELDRKEGERRRETEWIGVRAPERPTPRRSFAPLAGHEYTFNGQQWKRCDGPEEFGDYLERMAKERNWFLGATVRKGTPVAMKRPALPIEIFTTTFSPWLANWTAAELAANRDPRPQLAKIRNTWLTEAQRTFADKRHILGFAFHCDSAAAPHFDLVLTRQDGNGGRIGEAGLRLTGPWTIGVSRQLSAGAQINSEKRGQLRRAVANFHHRYGKGVVPLDVAMARSLDAAADTVLGADIVPFRGAYAARVPELEREHGAAKLASLEAAREKLLKQISTGPDVQKLSEGLRVPETDFPSPSPSALADPKPNQYEQQ